MTALRSKMNLTNLKSVTQKLLTIERAKAFTILDQIVISGSNFLLTLILFRLLGLESFGIYTIFFMILITLQTIHHTTINQPMMSMLPEVSIPNKRKILHGYFFLFHACVNLVFSSIATGVFSLFSSEEPASTFAIVFIIFALMQTHEFFRRLLFSSSLQGWAVTLDTIRYLGHVLLCFCALVFFHDDMDISDVFVLTMFAWTLPFVLSIPIIFRISKIQTKGFVPWLRSVLPSAAGLGLSGALQALSVSMYYLIVGIILSPVAVGILRAAQTTTSALPVLNQAVETYVPVKAAERFQNSGRHELIRFLRTGFGYVFMLTILISILVIVFSKPLTNLFFSTDVGDLTLPISLFCLTAIIEVGVGFLRFHFRALLKVKIVFYSSIASAATGITLVFPIVSSWGTDGAVVGILLSRLVALFVLIIAAVKEGRANKLGISSNI